MDTTELADGTFIIVDTDDDTDNPFDSYADENMVFDTFARRSTVNKFKDHEAAIAFAEDHSMHVFAVRCYSHSGDAYHVVEQDWDRQTFPFPQITKGLLPGQFGDQFDSAWAGYVMVAASHFMTNGKNASRISMDAKLQDAACREEAFKLAQSTMETFNGYIGGDLYRWTHESAEREFVDGLGGFTSEDEARQYALNTIKIPVKGAKPVQVKAAPAEPVVRIVELQLSL